MAKTGFCLNIDRVIGRGGVYFGEEWSPKSRELERSSWETTLNPYNWMKVSVLMMRWIELKEEVGYGAGIWDFRFFAFLEVFPSRTWSATKFDSEGDTPLPIPKVIRIRVVVTHLFPSNSTLSFCLSFICELGMEILGWIGIAEETERRWQVTKLKWLVITVK